MIWFRDGEARARGECRVIDALIGGFAAEAGAADAAIGFGIGDAIGAGVGADVGAGIGAIGADVGAGLGADIGAGLGSEGAAIGADVGAGLGSEGAALGADVAGTVGSDVSGLGAGLAGPESTVSGIAGAAEAPVVGTGTALSAAPAGAFAGPADISAALGGEAAGGPLGALNGASVFDVGAAPAQFTGAFGEVPVQGAGLLDTVGVSPVEPGFTSAGEASFTPGEFTSSTGLSQGTGFTDVTQGGFAQDTFGAGAPTNIPGTNFAVSPGAAADNSFLTGVTTPPDPGSLLLPDTPGGPVNIADVNSPLLGGNSNLISGVSPTETQFTGFDTGGNAITSGSEGPQPGFAAGDANVVQTQAFSPTGQPLGTSPGATAEGQLADTVTGPNAGNIGFNQTGSAGTGTNAPTNLAGANTNAGVSSAIGQGGAGGGAVSPTAASALNGTNLLTAGAIAAPVLGTAALLARNNNQLPSSGRAAQQIAGTEQGTGTNLINSANAGTVDPAFQPTAQAAINQLRQSYYSRGVNPDSDTAYFAQVAQINNQVLLQQFQLGQQFLNSASGVDLTLSQQQQSIQTGLDTALANLGQALGTSLGLSNIAQSLQSNRAA